MKPLTILSMGWGVQTWTLAAMMALDEHPRADHIVFADTGHEMEATYAFADKWKPWLGEHGLTVVTVKDRAAKVVMEQWSGSVMIPAFTISSATGEHGQVRRQCTNRWKVQPIRRFIRSKLAEQNRRPSPNSVECWIGISWDEWVRMRTSDVKYIANVYPLVDSRIKRIDCIQWLERHGLPVAPKSACTFCPFHHPTAWQEMKKESGIDWKDAVAVDKIIRNQRLTQHGPLFIHSGRKPLEQAVDIPEDHGAFQYEMDIGCEGGYCMV